MSKLAMKIAQELFTDGNGRTASRLVAETTKLPDGSILSSGWSIGPATDVIARNIAELEAEVEYLRFFHSNIHDYLGPADSDCVLGVQESYTAKTGKKVPDKCDELGDDND